MALPIKAQQTRLLVATAAGSAVNITGITAAKPPVVSATAHGQANGTVGVIASVGGMIELNDRAVIVANQASGTFELKGVDASLYTAYSSGGTFTPQTMAEVGGITNIGPLFGGAAQEQDATDLRSIAEEIQMGIPRKSSTTMTLKLGPSDTAQERLYYLMTNQLLGTFEVILSSGASGAFRAFVTEFAVGPFSPDGWVAANLTLRQSGAESRIA